MFERPQSGERAVLVHVHFHIHSDHEVLEEFELLARSAGAHVVNLFEVTRDTPDPKYFIGSGKAEEIAQFVKAQQIQLVIFNHSLSPAQERNLERIFQCRVLDRTGLILDIFAQRARTSEGKLQVELAQLKYISTRLVRGWTHLERQKGGIGLRGPGETQLETDRRLIRGKIDTITKRLDKVRQTRAQSRQARAQSAIPVIALVGYTNAGKSTLFNALTQSDVYVAHQLFATLDPTLRKITIPYLGHVILVDTVGFIRELPHDLVDAFRATLEETTQANMLLHVIDAADPLYQEKQEEVNDVLKQIDAGHVPQIEVFNKIDQLSSERLNNLEKQSIEQQRVFISARLRTHFDDLMRAIARFMESECIHLTLQIPPALGHIRSELYNQQAILNESVTDQGDWCIEVKIRKAYLEQLFNQIHESWEDYRIENISH